MWIKARWWCVVDVVAHLKFWSLFSHNISIYFYSPTGTEARTSLRALKCWTAFSNLEESNSWTHTVHICAHDLTSYVHMCWGENSIFFSHGRRLSSTSFVGIDFHPGTSCIPIKGGGVWVVIPKELIDPAMLATCFSHRLENYFGDAEAVRRATSFRDSATWQFDGG